MLRSWFVVLCALAACGRLRFDALAGGRGGSGDGGVQDGAPADAATGFSHLVAYGNQTCGFYAGAAYCWGDNSNGALGIGTTGNAAVPTRMVLPAGTVDDLSQGDADGCAVVGGAVYCAGTMAGSATPVAIAVPSQMPVRAVSAGRGFACALTDTVYCWGTNGVGQLGTGDTTAHATPTQVAGGTAYAAIDAGDDHVCAVDIAHVAWCWGHNDYGTLGPNVAGSSSNAPVALDGNVTTLPLIAGWHACALASNGTVQCWGEGDHGELGDGLSQNSATTRQVAGLTGVTAVTTGGGPTDLDASCAITGGAVWCWGNGFYGRLGQGSANPSTVPVRVAGLPGPAVEVAIGYDHACARLADGNAWCWGRGDAGQLGDGTSTSSFTPVEVRRPASGG